MKVDVLETMDHAIRCVRSGVSPEHAEWHRQLTEARAAIAELMDAVEWHLRCMDEYPENPVPMNREGGTTRELRTALAKALPP